MFLQNKTKEYAQPVKRQKREAHTQLIENQMQKRDSKILINNLWLFVYIVACCT